MDGNLSVVQVLDLGNDVSQKLLSLDCNVGIPPYYWAGFVSSGEWGSSEGKRDTPIMPCP